MVKVQFRSEEKISPVEAFILRLRCMGVKDGTCRILGASRAYQTSSIAAT